MPNRSPSAGCSIRIEMPKAAMSQHLDSTDETEIEKRKLQMLALLSEDLRNQATVTVVHHAASPSQIPGTSSTAPRATDRDE